MSNSDKRILVTGASGLVGQALVSLLLKYGFSVRILSRIRPGYGRKITLNSDTGKSAPGKSVLEQTETFIGDINKGNIKEAALDGVENAETFIWDINRGYIEKGALDGLDHIIHLAGENIGQGRWTKNKKQRIIDSRTKSTELLLNKCKQNNIRLLSFVSASATGYYGSVSSEKIYSEEDAPGGDFTARVCSEWERSAGMFNAISDRVVILRTGIVLSGDGGMLKSVLPTARMRFSPLFGDGKHYIPWIHINDLCNIYLHAVNESKMSGVYNAVSPKPVTYKVLIRELARVKGHMILTPPTPRFIWNIVFGEKSVMLLNGSRISSDRISSAKFNYEFPVLSDAFADLLK